MKNEIIIGTRSSALAICQTKIVQALIQQRFPDLKVLIKEIETEGDINQSISLSKVGDKGLFTRNIEKELLSGEIDMAVHSFKDLPTQMPDGLIAIAVSERENPKDAFISQNGIKLSDMAPGSRIGTCSLRRKVQLELIRPDINTSDIRGNVDTRLKKMDSGMYDGIILACAGLSRLNLNNRISEVLDWYYAPGQGALAAEIRIDNFAIKSIIESVTEKAVMQQVIAERAFIHRLNGGCHIPIGVKCSVNDAMLKLDGWLSSQDGSRIISDCISGKLDEASSIGTLLAEKLIAQGAGDIL